MFDLDDAGLATKVRIGAEVDMGLPTAASRPGLASVRRRLRAGGRRP